MGDGHRIGFIGERAVAERRALPARAGAEEGVTSPVNASLCLPEIRSGNVHRHSLARRRIP